MQIFVTARPRAKKQEVKKNDATHYTVSVTEAPEGGKANLAVLRALSEYCKVPISYMFLKRGQMAKKKIIEIKNRV